MKLTWRDGVATVLVAATGGLYIAYLAGADLPLAGSPRALAVVALTAGIGACAVGGAPSQTMTRYSGWMTTLGVAMFVPAVVTTCAPLPPWRRSTATRR
jgi:hypothetical protein